MPDRSVMVTPRVAGEVEQVSAFRQSTAISTRGAANYCHGYNDEMVHPAIPIPVPFRVTISFPAEEPGPAELIAGNGDPSAEIGGDGAGGGVLPVVQRNVGDV